MMFGEKGTRYLARFVAIALVVVHLGMATVAFAATVTLSWTFNYTVDTACTATVTKNCVSGFEYGTTPDSGTTLLKVGTMANPTPATTGATAVTTSFTQGPPYGSVVYYARTIGLDGTGTAVYSSVALSSTTHIVPGAPTGLTVTLH
jgi:hypothetical protein